jgi:uncharacterized protein
MSPTCSFERLREIDGEDPTLIEGLPGMGLVAAITVEHVRRDLGLEEVGHLRSAGFPPVAAFEDGLVEETLRVYGTDDPALLTLQSSIPVPEEAVRPLSRCVLQDLAHDFEQAIFLVGAPAQSEDDLGQVTGIATDTDQRDRLQDAGIELAEENGAIGGVTGGLLQACYRASVPAVALVVRCRPQIPDPGAARAVIEEGLEPLVDFDLDTSALDEREEEIQRRLEQVAQQYQQAQARSATPEGAADEAPASIYH